jgi:hypothetical protein
VRRLLLVLPVLASLLLTVDATGSTPPEGSLDHDGPSLTWSGTVAVQTAGFSGVGCQQAIPDPTCDRYALAIAELSGTDADGNPWPDDVRIAISTAAPAGTIAEFDLYVYGPDGTEVGRDTDLGSNDTVVLRAPTPGRYTVAVQSPLSSDPSATYDARADVVEAGPEVPVDAESECVDTAERIELRVRVVLDGVTPAEADAIFSGAAKSYAPLGIDLVADQP